MGASYDEVRYPGELGTMKLKEAFASTLADDRYENGHSYSGTIGMAQGLTITNKSFNSKQEASEYIENTAQKWGPALAVRYTETNPKKTRQEYDRTARKFVLVESDNLEFGQTYWLVGAICSS